MHIAKFLIFYLCQRVHLGIPGCFHAQELRVYQADIKDAMILKMLGIHVCVEQKKTVSPD